MRLVLVLLVFGLLPAFGQQYFPPAGQWQTKPADQLGFDRLKLQAAVEYAQAHGSDGISNAIRSARLDNRSGPVPEARAATNGIILRHGYIVAEFGDTRRTIRSTASPRASCPRWPHRVRGPDSSVNDPVASYIHDGGYDSPHNAKITWKNHLQQESEWEGEMWGKNANFVGRGRSSGARGSRVRFRTGIVL